jgi:hypothetical protein
MMSAACSIGQRAEVMTMTLEQVLTEVLGEA